jgi:hypothetical protein
MGLNNAADFSWFPSLPSEKDAKAIKVPCQMWFVHMFKFQGFNLEYKNHTSPTYSVRKIISTSSESSFPIFIVNFSLEVVKFQP